MSASTNERSPVRGNGIKYKCTSGWADFDLKQRQKQRNIEPGHDSEAYPLLSGSITSRQSIFNKNGALLEKPFSSVVVASMHFPSLENSANKNSHRRVPVRNCRLGATQNINEDVSIEAFQKLKYLHPWADESLIQDVLAGVNNNVAIALSLLESMLISETKDAPGKKVESIGNGITALDVEAGFAEENMNVSFIADNSFNKESKDDLPSVQILDASKSLPIEPESEWEDDDIYLIHRKDATRMIRLASRHSKAANDAYLRGDHTSALQFSSEAQKEWTAAEKLNSKAAREILNARNHKNDLWTLDLHGLHASEAVEALGERLHTVESLVSPNCLPILDGVYKESAMFLSTPVPSTSNVKMVKHARQHPPARQRQTLLQVITGKGNHSRGAAALPSAIKNFLSENGYHFDETRSGVIMIRLKFRKQ